jgi:hypothetical protein
MIAKAVAAMSAAIGLLVSAVLALFTALIMGSRARLAQPTRQRANPGTNGR